MRIRAAALVLVALLLPAGPLTVAARAAAATVPGSVDLAFGSCGVATTRSYDTYVNDHLAYQSGVAVQPDGRIVVAGTDVAYRLMADGTPDYSFGFNGSVFFDVQNAYVSVAAVLVQPDGKVLLAGNFQSRGAGYGPPPTAWFLRLLPNGSPDPTFGSGGRAEFTQFYGAYAAALQPDGRIVVAGFGGYVIRLLADGRLDTSFATGGTYTAAGPVVHVVLQPDGKMVVALARNTWELLRLTPAGTLDPTFGTNGSAVLDIGGSYGVQLALDGSGRIVGAGSWSYFGTSRSSLFRLLPNGAKDTSFGDGGVAANPFVSEISGVRLVLEPDGRPVTTASTRSGDYQTIGLARFTLAGEPDPSFGTGGVSMLGGPTRSDASDLARTPGGGWVVSGSWGYLPAVVGFSPGGLSLVTAQTCSREITITASGSYDFGSLPLGTATTPRGIMLTNTGTAPVHPGAIALLGAGQSQFPIVDGCSGRTLAPGASCSILEWFAPTVAGFSEARLLVWTDTGERQYPFLLQGRDRQPLRLEGRGWNGFGQTGVGPADSPPNLRPIDLAGAISVAAGYYHTIAVTTDGSVWTWGWNGFGQLGDGTTANRYTPIRVPGLTGIAAVAAGAYDSFAIGRDGSVYAWGLNHVGQLGDGTVNERHSPVRINGLPPVTKISAGVAHTLALGSGGLVYSWGWNAFGQLGDGTTADRSVPAAIPGLAGMIDIAAGGFHNLAAGPVGPVRAWGLNHVGQLGDGTTTDRHSPVTIGLQTVDHVEAGAFHSLAVYARTVYGWGWNAVGQVGDGTTTDRHVPVLAAMPDNVLDIAAGPFHTVALRYDGGSYSLGLDAAGQHVGGGSTAVLTPFQGPERDVAAAGVYHTILGV